MGERQGDPDITRSDRDEIAEEIYAGNRGKGENRNGGRVKKSVHCCKNQISFRRE
jgi:hypothetical protein